MAKVRSVDSQGPSRKMRPALSPAARENQLISLAHDVAEQQMRDGTASSQVITHFLKLGTEKERLERERLEEENKLLRAKTKELEDRKEMKQMYAEALQAMRRYGGHDEQNEDY